MIALVTGASGHLGNVVARKLLDRGHQVRVLLRRPDPPALAGLEVDRYLGDLSDIDTLRLACEGAHWVFHCAAQISTVSRDARKVEQTNVVGTRNMIDAARSTRPERFVFVSSVEALDLQKGDGAISEEDGFSPDRCLMSYGRSKARATIEVLRAAADDGLPALVGIPSGLVGPYDFGSSRTGEMVRRFLARRIPASVDGGFDFVDVRDVAEGLLLAAEQGEIGQSYLLTGELVSYRRITEILGEISGVRMPRLNAPYWLALPYTYAATAYAFLAGQSPLYTPDSLRILRTWPTFNLDKSRTHLGYSPRPIEETLKDTAAWVQGRFAGALDVRGERG